MNDYYVFKAKSGKVKPEMCVRVCVRVVRCENLPSSGLQIGLRLKRRRGLIGSRLLPQRLLEGTYLYRVLFGM